MKKTVLVLTERHPAGREAPETEAFRRIVTAWLERELERRLDRRSADF